MLRLRDFRLPLLAAAALATSPALGSIQGEYSGNFRTAKSGGAAYSYIHKSTAALKNGDANYYQKAGGSVLLAMDNRGTVSFTVNDALGDGLTDGDTVDIDFEVDLLKFDGSLDSSNTLLTVVGTLSLSGTLNVGGNSSTSFTHGISNITASDTQATHQGLDYTVDITSPFSIDSHSFAAGDQFAGDVFFQSGALAGPFNGISYDAGTKTISLAVWGDSRNMDGRVGTDPGNPNNTGQFDPVSGSTIEQALGFDIYIEAQIVPEAASVIVWTLLACVGLVAARRERL